MPDATPETAAVEALERYLEAANRGDVETMIGLTEPTIEFGTARSILRGHAALRSAMATPRPFDLLFEAQRFYAAGGQVVCVGVGRFNRRTSGDPAGESPIYVRAEFGGRRLRRLRTGYPDAATALADAGLTDEDAWHGEGRASQDGAG